jgi:signal peptide peptidase SppA
MSKYMFPEQIWAGTEHSLQIAMEGLQKIEAMGAWPDPDDNKDKPRLFSQQDAIGVVAIKGSLVNNDSPYNKYAGVTGYSEIREAMIHAATDESVKAIVLDVNSGGGAVSGLSDTADLIAMIDKSVKPVYAFAEGNMYSAAYWLGVSAREVTNSKTAGLGSIGVITTHMDLSKLFKEMGIGVTVIRAGEFKALGHPYEPLTEKAQQQIQGQLNTMYGIFIGHVAGQLGMTVDAADKTIGQGREFIGQDAVAAGLSKGIDSFDSLMGKIGVKLQSAEVTHSQFGNHSMTKKALTEKDVLAINAGIDTGAEKTAEELAAEKAAADQAAADAAAAAAAAAVTQPEAAKDQSAVVALLQTQLAASQAEVVTLKVSAAQVAAERDAAKASVGPMAAIIGASLTQMKVALGMPKVDYSAMAPEALLADHKATAEAFTKAFKAGGVAAVTTEDTAPKGAKADPNHLARVKATAL